MLQMVVEVWIEFSPSYAFKAYSLTFDMKQAVVRFLQQNVKETCNMELIC